MVEVSVPITKKRKREKGKTKKEGNTAHKIDFNSQFSIFFFLFSFFSSVSVPFRGIGFERVLPLVVRQPLKRFPSPFGELGLKVPSAVPVYISSAENAFPSPFGELGLKVSCAAPPNALWGLKVSVPFRGIGFESPTYWERKNQGLDKGFRPLSGNWV